eukprot:scaffold47_cov258-Pinguiococcus_pyrenoidosus.AAC.8
MCAKQQSVLAESSCSREVRSESAQDNEISCIVLGHTDTCSVPISRLDFDYLAEMKIPRAGHRLACTADKGRSSPHRHRPRGLHGVLGLSRSAESQPAAEVGCSDTPWTPWRSPRRCALGRPRSRSPPISTRRPAEAGHPPPRLHGVRQAIIPHAEAQERLVNGLLERLRPGQVQALPEALQAVEGAQPDPVGRAVLTPPHDVRHALAEIFEVRSQALYASVLIQLRPQGWHEAARKVLEDVVRVFGIDLQAPPNRAHQALIVARLAEKQVDKVRCPSASLGLLLQGLGEILVVQLHRQQRGESGDEVVDRVQRERRREPRGRIQHSPMALALDLVDLLEQRQACRPLAEDQSVSVLPKSFGRVLHREALEEPQARLSLGQVRNRVDLQRGEGRRALPRFHEGSVSGVDEQRREQLVAERLHHAAIDVVGDPSAVDHLGQDVSQADPEGLVEVVMALDVRRDHVRGEVEIGLGEVVPLPPSVMQELGAAQKHGMHPGQRVQNALHDAPPGRVVGEALHHRIHVGRGVAIEGGEVRAQSTRGLGADLQTAAKERLGKLRRRKTRHPQSELQALLYAGALPPAIEVRLVELHQRLLQRLQPAGHEVGVLQEEPVARVEGRAKQVGRLGLLTASQRRGEQALAAVPRKGFQPPQRVGARCQQEQDRRAGVGQLQKLPKVQRRDGNILVAQHRRTQAADAVAKSVRPEAAEENEPLQIVALGFPATRQRRLFGRATEEPFLPLSQMLLEGGAEAAESAALDALQVTKVVPRGLADPATSGAHGRRVGSLVTAVGVAALLHEEGILVLVQYTGVAQDGDAEAQREEQCVVFGEGARVVVESRQGTLFDQRLYALRHHCVTLAAQRHGGGAGALRARHHELGIDGLRLADHVAEEPLVGGGGEGVHVL